MVKLPLFCVSLVGIELKRLVEALAWAIDFNRGFCYLLSYFRQFSVFTPTLPLMENGKGE